MTGTASSLNSTVSGSAQNTYDERGCLTVTSVTQTLKMIHSATGYCFLYVGGITLRSGRRGFAIYREGKVIEQYSVIGR